MFRTWWQKLFVFTRSRNLRRRRLADPRRLPRTRRLSMTALEDRITPAFNTLISLNPTIGVNVATVAGTTTFTANASGANVSILDVSNELSLGRNVIVTSGSTGAEAGNIAMSGFANTSLNNLAGTSLTIQSGSGANLVGDISLQGVTFQQAASYTVSANRNVTFDQTTAASSIFVTAFTGSVTNSATTSIQATNLAITAATGIGSLATPLNTTVQNLEAATTTGGIFINNQGSLTIGGVSAGLNGLSVATSGDIVLTNAGSITLADTNGTEVVRGGAASGNVTLNANGATSDISSTVNLDSVTAPKGSIILAAGRDIKLGTAGANFDNDVRADSGVSLTAGRDIIVDGFADVSADAFGNATGGTATLTAGRNITLGPTAASDVSVTALTGPVVLTTGVNGVFALTNGAVVSTTSGPATVNADDVVIDATGEINAAAGIVRIQQVSTNRTIDLGMNSAGNLGLTQTELNRITGSLLRIGSSSTDVAGGIIISAPIAGAASFGNTLSLFGGAGSIVENAGGTLSVVNLAAQAALVQLTNANNVNNLAGTTSQFFQSGFQLTNVGNLNVGTVDGIAGVKGVNAAVQPFGDIILMGGAGSVLTVSQAITTPNGRIFLTFDDMVVNAAITAPALGFFAGLEGLVTLAPASAGRAIDLGFNTVGRLGLTDSELDFVTAGTALRIGAATNTGGIFVTNQISAPAGYSTLHLISGAAITDGTATEQADLIVANLALEAGFGIGNADSIDVAGPAGAPINVAFKNTNLGVQIAELGNSAGMVISSVDGVATSSNIGTTTKLTAASPLTFAVNTISNGDLLATATEISDALVFADKLTVIAGVTVQSTGGNVTLQAGDDVVLNTGSVIQSNLGFVTLTAAFGDLDAEGGINMGGGTIQAGTNVTLTALNDILLSTVTAGAAGTVTITSTAANILDDGINATLVSGDSLSLTAFRAIGQPGATAMIDTAVNTLTAATTGPGSFVGVPTPGIWVADVDNLTVTTATTVDGVILIDAGANLIVQTVTANGAGRSVRLRALGGNLTIGTVTAEGDIVALSATGAIFDGNAAGNNVKSSSLSIIAGAGVADSYETMVSNVAWSTGTGGITLVNSGGLTVTTVTAFGVTVVGGTGAGAADVTATSPLTVARNITMGGDVTLTAGEVSDALVFADKLKVNTGITVQSTGGNVALRAGDDIVLEGGALVQSNLGSVTLNAAFNDLDSEGGISANGATIQAATKATLTALGDIVLGVVTVTNGDITIVTAGAIQLNQALTASGIVRLQAGTGIASTAATGTITANALGVRNTATGDIQLDRDNLVQVFAGVNLANNAGINFRNTSALLLDNVTADGALFAAVNGVATTGGLGAIRLQATGLTQTAVGLVTGSQLGIHNTTIGDVVLDQGNTVLTFAAINTAVGAGINFRNTIALSLDTVSDQGTFTTVDGVTTTGAGGTVRLQQTGLTQTDVGIVTSDLLGVRNTVAGDVMLDRLNQVNTFAASNTFLLGQVVLNNGRAVLIGSVGTQQSFGITNGIMTNNGVAQLQAAGNITQTAQGLVSVSALAVLTTTGQIIRLDQGNTVPTFAANNGVTGGLVNFRTTGSLIIANVASNSGLLQAVTGITMVDGTALIRAANGISQSATGFINTGPAGQLAVRNDATGDISLLQTDYVLGTGNSVGTFAGESFAAGGRVDFATLGSLTLGTVTGDGTFLQARGIQAINNGLSNLRTGNDFRAVDPGFTLVNLGAAGRFLLNPGQTGLNNNITYDAEAIAGNFRLGDRNSSDSEAQFPGALPGQNPPDTTGTNNSRQDTFNVRPSAFTLIIVNGNFPTTIPGDVLNLMLDGGNIGQIQFVPGGAGAGRFNFTGGAQSLAFTGIESVFGLSLVATSVQTGPTQFTISAGGTIQQLPLQGGIVGGTVVSNPFIVSPNLVNPIQPFGPARIALGDFNGDFFPDLIIANGPNNAPLVTVVNGRRLLDPTSAGLPIRPVDIVAQFFAYDPRFFGGIFVAAADLNGDGRAEIITGADSGGGPHVNYFKYTGPAPNMNGTFPPYDVNNAVDQFSSPEFPRGGFYAFSPNFTGGVRVATGDVNGDGTQDIIAGAGPGGGPHVKVYNGILTNLSLISEFFAYDAGFRGGVFVGAGDYGSMTFQGFSLQPPPLLGTPVFKLDGKADVITGAGPGGGPHVKVYDGSRLSTGQFDLLTEFFAFAPESNSLYGRNPGDTTGVESVSLADVNGDGVPDILVTSNRGPRTRLRAFLGNSANPPAFTFPAPTLGFPELSNGDLFFSYLTDGSNATGLFGST